MPKFIYTTILGTLFLWVCVFFFAYKISPDTLVSIFVFLLLFFCAVGFTLAILSFLFLHKTSSRFANTRSLYKRAIKWGFYASFGLTGTLGLKAFDLINFLNYGLFLAMYVVVFIQLKSKNR